MQATQFNFVGCYEKYKDLVFATSFDITRDKAKSEIVVQEVFDEFFKNPHYVNNDKELENWLIATSREFSKKYAAVVENDNRYYSQYVENNSERAFVPHDEYVLEPVKAKKPDKWGKGIAIASVILLLGMIPLAASIFTGLNSGSQVLYDENYVDRFVDDDDDYFYKEFPAGESTMTFEDYTMSFGTPSGDVVDCMVPVDIEFTNEKIGNEASTVYLLTRFESDYEYENGEKIYAGDYGVRDSYNPNLYHFQLKREWVFSERQESGSIIITPQKVSLIDDADSFVAEHELTDKEAADNIYRVDMENLHDYLNPVYDVDYFNNCLMSDGDIVYAMRHALFTDDYSELNFFFRFEGTNLADGSSDFEEVRDKFNEAWFDFANDLILEVDGEEYRVTQSMGEKGEIYCDTINFDKDNRNMCQCSPRFDAIDHQNAEKIVLKCGKLSYVLKGEGMPAGSVINSGGEMIEVE